MKITKHAQDRAAERLGIPHALLPDAAETAFQHGIAPDAIRDSDLSLYRYLLSLLARHTDKRAVMRVLAEHVWIWALDPLGRPVLLTVRPLKEKWRGRTPREAVRIMPEVRP